MGKKGGWFSAVKRIIISDSNEKKDKKKLKSRRWFGKQKELDAPPPTEPVVATPMEEEEVKEEEVKEEEVKEEEVEEEVVVSSSLQEMKLAEAENEQNKHAYSVALATAVAAEAAVAAAKAAAEVVRLTAMARYPGKSKEEIAAIKIQTAFRGYMARRALRALRGLVRLKTMIEGQSVKRQATTTLRCMQTLSRVQSQIRARRIRMSEENEALQRQLQQKREREIEKLRASTEGDWNDSRQSKEEHEARMQSKQEAAIRRERALAYAHSHQQTWRNNLKSTNQTFMDPNNPHWGWSWLERWMAARPWEAKTTVEKELDSDRISVKSTATLSASVGDFRSYHDDMKPSPSAKRRSRPPSRHQSPSTPQSKAVTSSRRVGRLTSPSLKGSDRGMDEDSRSLYSTQSEFPRRHSIAGSSVRDDESFSSSPAIPSYMASTHSAKAKSRFHSPLASENVGTPDKGSSSSTKKRLSFSTPPSASRRHSVPPKMDSSSIKDIMT